ncbi:MAG: hypothetical protein AB8G23_20315 [Myxococcota bacterium]
MSEARVFSEEELRIFGMRSVDAMAEALDRRDLEGARAFVRRLRREVLSMIRNYAGWEVTLTAWIERNEGEPAAARAVQEMENPDIAPERCGPGDDPVPGWKIECEEILGDLDAGRTETALTRARALHETALVRHDRGMSRVSALLSFIGRAAGVEGLDSALREAMAADMIGTASFRERAEALMHFTRVHLQTFDLVEDDEKLTFICPICPSGGRMIADGHYEAPRSDYVVPGPHPLTYGRDEIPVYCCHEPVMETTSFEGTGVPMFIVDPAPELGKGPCKTYLYKNPAAIPEHFFTRLGLEKPRS